MKHKTLFLMAAALLLLPLLWRGAGGEVAAQNIGINSAGTVPNLSAGLDVDFTNKGLLIPRLTEVQRLAMNPLPQAAQGLLVYQKDGNEGFYYNTSITTAPNWVFLFSTGTGWAITGNTGTLSGTNFAGTTDAQAYDIRTFNVLRVRITTKGQIEIYNTGQSVFVGEGAGNSDDLTLNRNTFIGYRAGYTNSTGEDNVGMGSGAFTTSGALYSNTSGARNTAIGYASLFRNTAGSGNTSVGVANLNGNTTASANTAAGYGALNVNSTTTNNTAIGMSALTSNAANYNTSTGYFSLWNNSSGLYNTAIGYAALYSNTTATRNTAIGYRALYTGSLTASFDYNTAIGSSALTAANGAVSNTATGYNALSAVNSGDYNTAFGASTGGSITTTSYNTFFGRSANSCATCDNTTAIAGNGNLAIGVDNTIRFGNASMTAAGSIGGYAAWGTYSDKRFKKNIAETVPGLAFITKLRPVTYYIDLDKEAQIMHTPDSLRDKESEIIGGKLLQTGFLAQEVEKAANEINYDFSGIDKPQNQDGYYGLRYEIFTVPLVKAIQEQQAIIKKQKEEIAELKSMLNELLSENLYDKQ